MNNFERIEKGRKKLSFKLARGLVKLLYPRPKYRFLGEGFGEGPFIFIANHSGSNTPTRVECYFPKDFYMWGTYETTVGFKSLHKYLIHTYYHQKKKVPLLFASIIGTIFAPFAYMFFQEMRIIPTYTDHRFITTIKASMNVIKDGKAIVIYPEDSSDGYKEKIEKFYNGFLAIGEIAKKRGYDLPIFVSYYHKKQREFIIDKPISYSALMEKYNNQDDASNYLRERMNELMNK